MEIVRINATYPLNPNYEFDSSGKQRINASRINDKAYRSQSNKFSNERIDSINGRASWSTRYSASYDRTPLYWSKTLSEYQIYTSVLYFFVFNYNEKELNNTHTHKDKTFSIKIYKFPPKNGGK